MVSLVWIIQFFFPLLRNRNELIFGMLPGITDYYFLVFLLPALLIGVIYSTIIILKNRISWKLTRVYYLLFTVASIGWVLFLIRWNFMGYNF